MRGALPILPSIIRRFADARFDEIIGGVRIEKQTVGTLVARQPLRKQALESPLSPVPRSHAIARASFEQPTLHQNLLDDLVRGGSEYLTHALIEPSLFL
jgi:hypothetical protein